MANQFDRRRINVKGGGTLKIREIDPTPGSFVTIGFLKDVLFEDAHQIVDSQDAQGDAINSQSGGHAAKLSATLMQTNADEINLVSNAALLSPEKFYEAFYSCLLANGNTQELLIPIGRIRLGLSLEFKSATERNIKIEISALAPSASLTRTPTEYNTVAKQAYVLIENAVAKAAPSDAGTVPQAAI